MTGTASRSPKPQADKRRVLRELTFGARVAEEEVGQLASYFVETDQWNRMYEGEIDVVYGAKGSGKSAIYALLLDRENDLFDRGIILAGAEDPRGAPVFIQLVSDPPTNEEEFRAMWKLYFISLIGRQIREYNLKGSAARQVVRELEEAGLLDQDFNLRRLLRSTLDYVRAVIRAESFEGGIKLDPHSGMPAGLTGKITFREPSNRERRQGLVSADEVCELADRALSESQLDLWLLLDRLDVAFADSEQLEANALRALFRVYADLRRLTHISLKIFLRSDIWQRITEGGFREASHITRDLTIAWDRHSLLNLVVRRLLQNDIVKWYYTEVSGEHDRYRDQYELIRDEVQRREYRILSEETILRDARKQRRFFYRVFPRWPDDDQSGPETFEWILSLVCDGSGAAEPRELIHLLSVARNVQLRKLEVGQDQPLGEVLFDIAALREALPEVSRVRLQQTLFAEYPQCRDWIETLAERRVPLEYSSNMLASIWAVSQLEANRRAERLVNIGVFALQGSQRTPSYVVPELYRAALGRS